VAGHTCHKTHKVCWDGSAGEIKDGSCDTASKWDPLKYAHCRHGGAVDPCKGPSGDPLSGNWECAFRCLNEDFPCNWIESCSSETKKNLPEKLTLESRECVRVDSRGK